MSCPSNLAKEQPGKVRRICHALRDYLKHVNAPMPRLNPHLAGERCRMSTKTA